MGHRVRRRLRERRRVPGAGRRRLRNGLVADHPVRPPADRAGEHGRPVDATEIDEILSLRTMTLTEDEKREVRGTDPRAAELLARVDTMPQEFLDRLHGTVRYLASTGEGRAAATTPPDPGDVDGVTGMRAGKPGSGCGPVCGGPTRRTCSSPAARHRGRRTVRRRRPGPCGGRTGRRAGRGPAVARAGTSTSPGRTRANGGSAMTGGVLVAGLGNIFCSDDGFGVAVVEGLAERARPGRSGRLRDFGIRRHPPRLPAARAVRRLVLVDAIQRGRSARGRCTSIDAEPATSPARGGAEPMDAHDLAPDACSRLFRGSVARWDQ